MQPNDSTLTALLEDANYATYKVTMHYRSHQIRGEFPPDCRTCADLDADEDRAEAAVTAYCAQEEAAA